MTVHSGDHRLAPARARRAALLGYDGRIATSLLRIFQYFLVSVSFLACLAPTLAFHALIGWQATHLAVWLSALVLLPVAPGTFAAIAAASRVLTVTGANRAGRVFWRSFGTGARSLWWLAAAVSAVALILGYDLALLGADDTVFLLVVVGAALLMILVVAVSSIVVERGSDRPLALIRAAVAAIVAKPHVALSWLLLVVIGGVALQIPVIGTSAALFLPALVAAAIVICNTALRFHHRSEEPAQ